MNKRQVDQSIKPETDSWTATPDQTASKSHSAPSGLFGAIGRLRARFSTRLTRKIHVAFALMLLCTLSLAWYFHDSVEWYEYDMKHLAAASDVLHGYQSVAVQALQLKLTLPDLMESPDGATIEPEGSEINSIRLSLGLVRQGLAETLTLGASRTPGEKLERLVEIERVFEGIALANANIRKALREGDRETAQQALDGFRLSGAEMQFFKLVNEELATQRLEVQQAHKEAVDLAAYISQVLPIFVVGFTLFTVLMVWWFSRNLTHSVSELRQGAVAFQSGDLAYRIPTLHEKEFRNLGDSFNRMAHELAEHRTQLHDANVSLEAMVEERTRALKDSNARLEDIDDNRRKLLADISHEFRTPLTVIQGEAEIALRGKARTVATYRDSLDRIRDQARQTTRLVDDLLFIARADVGEPRLMQETVRARDILEGVCDDFSASARAREITIEPQWPEEEVTLHADRGRLRQVFAILLDNALRYSSKGGSIETVMKCDGDMLTVTVSDRGIGLTDAERNQAFERFFRGSRAVGQDEGSGLGLPVARAIVQAHAGEITLEPREGGGTTARVTLPRNRDYGALV